MNFDSLKLTWLSSCSVQSISSFQHHLRCIVGKRGDLRCLKLNINEQLFQSLLTTHACDGELDLYTLHQTEIRDYLPLVALHAHGPMSNSYRVQRTQPVDTWAKFLK